MVLFNYSTRELTAKIVYYGPGLCGKTTNLQYIHSTLPQTVKGKMLSLATKTDRTLFFDFLPIDLGEIRGMKTRVQLYTVPGQVFYNETRKLVLKGADGIVFVADSQAAMLGANVESFRNLEENLKAHGMKLSEMPHVLQFNKRDLTKLSDIEELNGAINRYNAPFYESVATTGIGIQDTLKAVTKLVLLNLTKKYDPKAGATMESATTPSAPVVQPAQVQVPQPPQVQQPPAFTPPSPIPEPVPVAAQTVQMSSASLMGAETEAGLPVSGNAAEASEPFAAFGQQEIDRLVDEVEETEPPFEATPVDGPGLAAGSMNANDLELSGAAARPIPKEAVPSGGNGSFDDPVFEIDHQVDPDWSTDAPEISAQVAPVVDAEDDEAWQVGPEEDLSIASSDAAVDASVEIPDLTDELDDRELFEGDAGLDVARLVAGEEREVIVPVALSGEDSIVRRFKLTLRLRLDPVDGS